MQENDISHEPIATPFGRNIHISQIRNLVTHLRSCPDTPREFVFQEQSYSSLYSGRSLEWDHIYGDIDNLRGAIADFCGVIVNLCRVVAIPASMRRCLSLRDLLNIKHC